MSPSIYFPGQHSLLIKILDWNLVCCHGEKRLQYYLPLSFGCYPPKPKINNGSMSFLVVFLSSLCLETRHQVNEPLGECLEDGGFLKWENSTILCAKNLNMIKKSF